MFPCMLSHSSVDNIEEIDLVARLQAGDQEAYRLLVQIHGALMFAVAKRFFSDNEDAADAVQDALISAYRGIQGFEGTARLGTWLHRITVNTCLMHLRRRKRIATVPLDDLLPSFNEEGQHAPAVVQRSEREDPLTREETCAQVRAGIHQLPDAYRTVLILRDMEGLSTEETANYLGTTIPVIKTRLHRARQALKILLEPSVI